MNATNTLMQWSRRNRDVFSICFDTYSIAYLNGCNCVSISVWNFEALLFMIEVPTLQESVQNYVIYIIRVPPWSLTN